MPELAPGLHAARGQEVDASAYDRFVGSWSRLFVPAVTAAAGIGPGCRVLDISTGTGEAAIPILPVIGSSGVLVGADISLEMVKSGRQRVNDSAFWAVVSDGQALAFKDGCFDAVVCQLGLQFFPNPARGLTEFRRVLRPGGKASVCVISTPDQAPMWGVLAETVGRYLPERRDTLMASFSLADPERLKDLFMSAGFTNIRVVREMREGTVESFDKYWESVEAGIGSIPQSYLQLIATDRRAVRQEVKARLSQFMASGKLHMSVEMLIGSGQAN